jgi:hypothetical protein
MLLAFPQVFSEKMTSLEISDMYFVKFDVFVEYLNNVWSMFVQQVSVQVYMAPDLHVESWKFCNQIHERGRSPDVGVCDSYRLCVSLGLLIFSIMGIFYYYEKCLDLRRSIQRGD